MRERERDSGVRGSQGCACVKERVSGVRGSQGCACV